MRYLILVLALTGCVQQQINDRLHSLIGQDIHVAIQRLGYPGATREIVGDTVYTWSTDLRAPYPCKVEIVAGPDNLIKTYSAEGTDPGCARYNSALGE